MTAIVETPTTPILGSVTVDGITADVIFIRPPRPGGGWVHFGSPYGVTLGAPDTLTAESAMAMAPAELAHYLRLPR